MTMNGPENDVRQRLDYLVLKAARQRSEIAVIGSELQKSLRWADLGFTVGRVLRSHPLLSVTAATLLVRLPVGSRLRWLGRLVTGLELFNAMRKERSLR
jgi:hypothetical protein